MDCLEVERLSDLSLDGEIEESERAELEAHLQACPACRRNFSSLTLFQANVRSRLRTSSDEMIAPETLKNRVTARIREEDRNRRFPLSTAIPVTMGVAVIAVFSWTVGRAPITPEETVSTHSKNLPPEVRATLGEERVMQLFKSNLPYRVQVPQLSNVRLVGARLSSIRKQDAAYVIYDQRGARISYFVFPKERAEMPPSFQKRRVGERPVQVGRHRGYNVVFWEEEDLTHSLVSDVDQDDLIRMVHSFK